MKKLLLLLAVMIGLMPLSVLSVSADDGTESLDERIQEVISEYDLDESSFSVAYYDTVNCESYSWNGGAYMFSASVYKLPLNMYYYLLERDGKLDPHADIGGYDLANAHYLSIVMSDNDASEALKKGLGAYDTYKNEMFTTFGSPSYQNLSDLPGIVYEDVYYPADFLMDVLKYLNANRSSFSELLRYMSAPEQRNGFENTLRYQYTVYQKQGWYESVNTVAEIVETDEPYLAVIMTNDQKHHKGAEICQKVNEILNEYNSVYAEQRKYELESKRQEMEDRISMENEIPEAQLNEAGDQTEKTQEDGSALFMIYAVVLISIPMCGILTVMRD